MTLNIARTRVLSGKIVGSTKVKPARPSAMNSRITIGGSGGGESNFFHFHAVFGQNLAK